MLNSPTANKKYTRNLEYTSALKKKFTSIGAFNMRGAVKRTTTIANSKGVKKPIPNNKLETPKL